MYTIDKESIEQKIFDSRFTLDEEVNRNIKEVFLNLVNEMCDCTNNVCKTLVESVSDRSLNNLINDIVVALIPICDEKNFEAIGLYKMVENNKKRIFIDDEYENIRVLAGDLSSKKKYRGKYIKDGVIEYFEYELKFDRSFLEVQELLFKYTQYYSIDNPVIFSPYSHKSFYVIYDDSLDKNNNKLDFCFEENGIKAIEDKNLFWNIKIERIENKTYNAKIPYGSDTRYVYSFKKNKQGKYLFPYPVNNQSIIYDIKLNTDEIEIITSKEMEDFNLLEYYDVDYTSGDLKAMISSKVLFNNKREYKGIVATRIVSEGDVEHAIAPFRKWNELSCMIVNEAEEKIIRYSSRYRVDRKDKSMFSKICTKFLRFTKKEQKFLTDYANYVMEYLEYYYPEIEWVGEK